MNTPAAHTHGWEQAETILGLSLLSGLILGFLFPLPLSRYIPRLITIITGILLLLASLALISVTRRQFRQAGQPTDPGQPTTGIIITGVFAWSRNPLYLAGMLAFLALGLLLNSLWLLILLVPTLIAVQVVLIAPEERYLTAKFGEPYRQYLATVHRWIGRR